MNKIGQLQLGSEIKIVDAFDFPEQFSIVNLANIQSGIWLVFNQTQENEMCGEIVSQFLLVEKGYFEKNPELYNWENHQEALSIEKGVIGIFNKDFVDSENYIDEMDEIVSNEHQAGVTPSYAVCQTPFGSDGYYLFDTITENNKIVAIKFDLNTEEQG